MSQLYVLFEHASGYGLFRVQEFEEVGSFLPQVEAAIADASKFKHVVKLVAYRAFTSAASALANINAISEGLLSEELGAFLEINLPKPGKKQSVQLGVSDPKLGSAISEATSCQVTHLGVVPEILRGIRVHLSQFVKGLSPASVKQTELGLGHSYSRGKVKFNVHRNDNMIIQSIALVDQMDKDVNTFAMRIKEWYSYHFPELAKVVPENYQYSLCAYYIKDRHTLSEESLPELEEIVMDSAKAQAILDASRMSMGMDISPIDLMNIERFAKRVIGLSEYRKQLAEYLKSKMGMVAPNLATLIGEVVGARLISHAGSLTNLAKYPASTVQILGAEKALFRAIKSKSNTPKYGLIFHSSFIGRAGTANKGRISRYLANKCSIATRIDCFSENLTTVFGERLKEQVEERLQFYETGNIPRKNAEVMSDALGEHNSRLKTQKRKGDDINGEPTTGESPKKKKKKKKNQEPEETALVETAEVEPVTPQGEKKKKKKKKNAEEEGEEGETEVAVTTPKKKKKNKQTEETAQVNGGNEEVAVAESGESAKKKKKKKNKLDESLNGTMEEEKMEVAVAESGESAKKKKKKKNKQVADEV